jgi:hypothetical protein
MSVDVFQRRSVDFGLHTVLRRQKMAVDEHVHATGYGVDSTSQGSKRKVAEPI